MSATAKTSVEIMAPPMPVRKIDDYSYTLGFSKGYEAADSSVVCWAFGICAVLVIICCFIVLYSHLSRQNDILSRFRITEKSGETTANGKFFSLLLPLALTICFAGCSVRQNEAVNPAPVPPDVVNAPAPADSADKGTGKFVPHDAAYRENGAEQSLDVYLPADPASGPRKGDPDELAELLEMKGVDNKEKTAVQLMRPNAIREAARLVTFQTAMSSRYGQLMAETQSCKSHRQRPG